MSDRRLTLFVGARLKNGAKLLAWKEERDSVVVLALWDRGDWEFVTWNLDTDGNCTSGHYYTDLLSAVEDFKTRT